MTPPQVDTISHLTRTSTIFHGLLLLAPLKSVMKCLNYIQGMIFLMQNSPRNVRVNTGRGFGGTCLPMGVNQNFELACDEDGQNVSFCVQFVESTTGCPSMTATESRRGDCKSGTGIGLSLFMALILNL
jgi:hypothetical protein